MVLCVAWCCDLPGVVCCVVVHVLVFNGGLCCELPRVVICVVLCVVWCCVLCGFSRPCT